MCLSPLCTVRSLNEHCMKGTQVLGQLYSRGCQELKPSETGQNRLAKRMWGRGGEQHLLLSLRHGLIINPGHKAQVGGERGPCRVPWDQDNLWPLTTWSPILLQPCRNPYHSAPSQRHEGGRGRGKATQEEEEGQEHWGRPDSHVLPLQSS